MAWRSQFEHALHVQYDHAGRSFDPSVGRPFDIDRLSCALIPPGSVVLDIGCGTGYISEYLEQCLRCTVIAVNSNPVEAELARVRCRHVVTADIENDATIQEVQSLCWSFGGADIVLASAVLEHLVYPDTLLMKLKGSLKSTGHLIVTLPNIAHWSTRWQLCRGRWQYADYGLLDRTHVRFFNFPGAVALIERCGYRITHWDIDPSSGLPKIGHVLGRNSWLAKHSQRLYRRRANLFAYQMLFKAALSS